MLEQYAWPGRQAEEAPSRTKSNSKSRNPLAAFFYRLATAYSSWLNYQV
jgi:hypothetical protein